LYVQYTFYSSETIVNSTSKIIFTDNYQAMIIGSRKLYFEKLASTNSHAHAMLRKGKVQEGTVVYTAFQSAGKGQAGNRWESEKGMNILMSVILFPTVIRADRQFYLTKIISLGVCDYLRSCSIDASIKWPNDIYVKDFKAGGILIENSIIRNEIDHCVAGIGLNVNQKSFPPEIPNPTSMSLITGREYDVEQCISDLCQKLDARYKQLIYNKTGRIDEDYKSSLYRLNQFTEFRDSRGIFEGRIISVSDSGRLHIEDRRGRIYEYGFREVDFL